MLLAGSTPLAGQEHGHAKTTAPTEHAKPAASAEHATPNTASEHAKPAGTKPQNVHVAPTLPPAKVAAAVAEALREAEAAAAKRAAKPAAPPLHVRSIPGPAAAAQPRKYELRWPEQRMVVQWPSTASDHVTLKWP
jgi:hypothetical protein